MIAANELGGSDGCSYALTVVDDPFIVRFAPALGTEVWFFELAAGDGSVCSVLEPQPWCTVRDGGTTLPVRAGTFGQSLEFRARAYRCDTDASRKGLTIGISCAGMGLIFLRAFEPRQMWLAPGFPVPSCQQRSGETITSALGPAAGP